MEPSTTNNRGRREHLVHHTITRRHHNRRVNRNKRKLRVLCDVPGRYDGRGRQERRSAQFVADQPRRLYGRHSGAGWWIWVHAIERPRREICRAQFPIGCSIFGSWRISLKMPSSFVAQKLCWFRIGQIPHSSRGQKIRELSPTR